jgi:two-component sensor histidine kinase
MRGADCKLQNSYRAYHFYLIAMKSLQFFLICLFIITADFLNANKSYSQIAATDSTSILQRQLNSSKDTNRVYLLLALGNRYLEGKVKQQQKIDTALILFNQAYNLSIRLKNNSYAYRSLTAIATYYLEQGEAERGRALFNKVISYYRQTGNKAKEAEKLNVFSEELVYVDSKKYRQESRENIKRAIQLYTQLGDKVRLAYLRSWKIREFMEDRQYDAAEKAALLMRAEYLRLKETGGGYNWVLNVLVDIAFQRSDLYQQLFYELENLDALLKHPKDVTVSALESCYYRLATIYFGLRNYQKTEEYASKQLPLTKQLNGSYTYGLYYWVTSLLFQHKPEAALKVLQKTVREFPALDADNQYGVYQLLGRIYVDLKKFPQAEKAYNQSLRLYELSDPKHERLDGFASAYKTMADFYILKGEFAKARPFLAKMEPIIPKLPPSYKMNFASAQSLVDSADGRYLEALKNFKLHKRLNDSLNNIDKTAKLNQLEVSFGTREKTSQINLLNAQNKAHISEAKRAMLERNITISGIILLAIILALMIYSFKTKVKVNRLLNLKQSQIESRNHSLSQLVDEKEALIHEKEGLLLDKDMLLKEVHHRVKNNLQIVMSLLSTQLVYLENKEAVDAIEESQQRVQSIALIHQKLYRESTGSSIELCSYVHDLVDDLESTFNGAHRGVSFQLAVEPIHLDVDQAVPIGLILNEAITNAIKYAFDHRGGKVLISIHQLEDQQLELVVKDNGKGLPENFDLAASSTLGMEMMRGLGKQLRGKLEVSNRDGVTLQLVFPLTKTSSQLVIASADSL